MELTNDGRHLRDMLRTTAKGGIHRMPSGQYMVHAKRNGWFSFHRWWLAAALVYVWHSTVGRNA